jgi:hypothetical protein
LGPRIEELLAHERVIPPQPEHVRARAFARARAALAASAGLRARPHAVMLSRPRRRALAVAAAIAGVAVVAASAAAYQVHRRGGWWGQAPAAQPAPVAAPAPVSRKPAPPVAPPPPVALASPPPERPRSSVGAHQAGRDPSQQELRLLRAAREAVAREDFATALPLLSEHARRFGSGRLAEEREALRVRSLAGLGRTQEARRAAAAFKARFPRSVLLPVVTDMPAADR